MLGVGVSVWDAALQSNAPYLAFTGSLSVAQGSAGPHFTLVVRKPPNGVTYTFAKTADPSTKFSLSTDEVTVTDSAVKAAIRIGPAQC